jgi:hypothetical protein
MAYAAACKAKWEGWAGAISIIGARNYLLPPAVSLALAANRACSFLARRSRARRRAPERLAPIYVVLRF